MQFKGLGVPNKYFCNAKMADVYTSALLADAMKPLKVLSKFENHFANQTVRFQVQLEADGYFFSGGFCVCICSKPAKVCQEVKSENLDQNHNPAWKRGVCRTAP